MKQKFLQLTSLMLMGSLFLQAQNYFANKPYNQYADGSKVLLSGSNEFKTNPAATWSKNDSFAYVSNAQNLPVKRLMYSLDSTKQNWYLRAVAEFAYNSAGKLTYEMDSTLLPNEIYLRRKNFYEYNASNVCTKNTQMEWSGSSWVYTFEYVYTLSANNYMIENLRKKYNKNTGQFRNYNRITYSYINQIYNDTATTSFWDTTTNSWSLSSRYFNKYDANNFRTRINYQNYTGGNWVNTAYTDDFYDLNGRVDSSYGYKWNSVNSSWNLSSGVFYNYPAAHTTLTLNKYWNNTSQTWVNLWKDNYVENSLGASLIYEYWDWIEDSAAFIKTYAEYSTYNANAYESERIFENYNPNDQSYVAVKTLWQYGLTNVSGIFNFADLHQTLLVYPNPSTGNEVFVNIENSLPYTIYDITGKAIQQGELLPGTNSIMLNEAKGIYILKAGNSTTRIVKE